MTTADDNFNTLIAGMSTGIQATEDQWNAFADAVSDYDNIISAYAESLGRYPAGLSDREKRQAFVSHFTEQIE